MLKHIELKNSVIYMNRASLLSQLDENKAGLARLDDHLSGGFVLE